MRDIFESTIDSMLGDLVTPALFRLCADGTWPAQLWDAIEDGEFPCAMVPETLGGSGATWDDTYVLIRAAGSHAVPAPLADTLLANWVLGRVGIHPMKGPTSVAAHAAVTCANGRATGLAENIPWGRHLKHIVIVSKDEDPSVLVLDTASAAEVEHRSNVAGEPRDNLRFHHARVVHAVRLPENLSADLLLFGGAMIRSAQIAGALQSLLQMTATYATERIQFGKPIGHFQVIQQQIALLAEHTASTLLAAEAAFAEAADDFSPLPVMAAKICAGEAASVAASIAHAVHGAIGFTDEHSLHLKTRRLWAWRAEYGSQTYWSQRLGRRICASGAAALWPTLTQSSAMNSTTVMESAS